MRLVRLLILLSLTFAPQLKAKIITALTLSSEDVAAAVGLAANGDTVVLPSGTISWDKPLKIVNKAIKVIGTGTNDTVIIDELTSRSGAMIDITFTNLGGIFHLANLQLRGGSNPTPLSAAYVRFRGSDLPSGNSKWRFHDIVFNRIKSHAIFVTAWNGLIDHCTFDAVGVGGIITIDSWFSNPLDFGDRSFATPVRWGTVDAGVYIENCNFSNTSTRGATDAYSGARFVFRYNVCSNVTVQTHGTESTGRIRGVRSIEVYGNSFYSPVFGGGGVLFRSGTGLVFSNTFTGKWPAVLVMDNYRNKLTVDPWGQATGANAWDQNYPTVFASGTHTGLSNSTLLTDSSQSWNSAQWKGYHLINLRTGKSGEILSNTEDTLTCTDPIFAKDQVYFSNGDRYEIRKIDRALDQPGVGQGDLLIGNPPIPAGWPHQVDEPIYYWANIGVTNALANRYNIIAGRNYTNIAKAGYLPLTYPHPFAGTNTLKTVSNPRILP